LERQALERQAVLALEKERQSALALERQSALALEKQALEQAKPLSQEQIMSNVLTGFFNANQN
jgi:hypothetical protein